MELTLTESLKNELFSKHSKDRLTVKGAQPQISCTFTKTGDSFKLIFRNKSVHKFIAFLGKNNPVSISNVQRIFSDYQDLAMHIIANPPNNRPLILILTEGLKEKMFDTLNEGTLVLKKLPELTCRFIRKDSRTYQLMLPISSAAKLVDFFKKENGDAQTHNQIIVTDFENVFSDYAQLKRYFAQTPPPEGKLRIRLSADLASQMFKPRGADRLELNGGIPEVLCDFTRESGSFELFFSEPSAAGFLEYLKTTDMGTYNPVVMQPASNPVPNQMEKAFSNLEELESNILKNPSENTSLTITVTGDLKNLIFREKPDKILVAKNNPKLSCLFAEEGKHYRLSFTADDIPNLVTFLRAQIVLKSMESEPVTAGTETVFATQEDLEEYLMKNLQGVRTIHLTESLKKELFSGKGPNRLELRNASLNVTCRVLSKGEHNILSFSSGTAKKFAAHFATKKSHNKRSLEANEAPKAKRARLEAPTQKPIQFIWRISFDDKNQAVATIIAEMSGIWGFRSTTDGNLLLANDGYYALINRDGKEYYGQATGVSHGIDCYWQADRTVMCSTPADGQTLLTWVNRQPPHFSFPYSGLDVVAIAPNPVNADEAVILNNRGLQLLRISEGRFIPLHEFLFGKTDCLDFACIPGEYPEYYVCLSNSQSIWKISTDPLTLLKETPFASGFTDLRGIAYSEQRNQFAVADGARILMLKADGAVFQEIPIENGETFTLEAVAATNNGDFFLLGKAL